MFSYEFIIFPSTKNFLSCCSCYPPARSTDFPLFVDLDINIIDAFKNFPGLKGRNCYAVVFTFICFSWLDRMNLVRILFLYKYCRR